jgi:hypothetical protein
MDWDADWDTDWAADWEWFGRWHPPFLKLDVENHYKILFFCFVSFKPH